MESPASLRPSMRSRSTASDISYYAPEHEDEVEDPMYYRLGGFHPIDIGAQIHKGMYTIERKLGNGGFATVWLAKHATLFDHRAIKILQADGSDFHETNVNKDINLNARYLHDPGHDHILKPSATFALDGPNGTHECLVFPPTEGHVGFHAAKFNSESLKSLLVQVLKGMALIHKMGYIHCDFHLNNIQFQAPPPADVSSNPESDKRPTRIKYPIDEYPLAEGEGGAPSFLYPNVVNYERFCAVRDFTKIPAEELIFKISDLGAAIKTNTRPHHIPTPIEFQAPEQMLGCILNEKVDVFTLGTSIFEIVTGEPFLPVDGLDMDDEGYIKERLGKFICRLGPVPADIRTRWAIADQFVADDGNLIDSEGSLISPFPECISRVNWGCNINGRDIKDGSERIFSVIKPEEKDMFIEFLSRMLQWRPKDRSTAAQLLKHEWLHDAKIPSREYMHGDTRTNKAKLKPLAPPAPAKAKQQSEPAQVPQDRKNGKRNWISRLLNLGKKFKSKSRTEKD